MRLPEAFRSLRYRDFRVFFVAQTISQIATWMHSVAQTWLILSLTNSPLLLGLITMLHWGPILLLALPGGAIADRVAKRRLLIATQAAQACTALTVAALVATGVVAYWHVGVLALCAGLANTLFNVVRQSFVNETVGRDDVVNAVALSSAAFNGARIVGPAAAGLVIASFGVAPAFVFSGAGYLLVLATLATVGVEGRPRRARPTTIRQDIAAGVAYALHTPEIRAVLGVLFVISFCVFNFSIWVPLLASNVLGQGVQGFGFLLAAVGVGAVCGAFTLGTRRVPPPAAGSARRQRGRRVLGAAGAVPDRERLARRGGSVPARIHRRDHLGRLPNVAPAPLVRRAAGTGHESLHADPRRLLPDRRPADRRRRRALERERRVLRLGRWRARHAGPAHGRSAPLR